MPLTCNAEVVDECLRPLTLTSEENTNLEYDLAEEGSEQATLMNCLSYGCSFITKEQKVTIVLNCYEESDRSSRPFPLILLPVLRHRLRIFCTTRLFPRRIFLVTTLKAVKAVGNPIRPSLVELQHSIPKFAKTIPP